ncbi:unnamed protein product [Mytilus coruscus]|uniref:Uncharacterized protein n=1 Tax=Mytilus coruscus TaxID=42192 RepID=A0A6J8CVS1_MYTCO|nr:unnamed protein product [Mytilus coruscus]
MKHANGNVWNTKISATILPLEIEYTEQSTTIFDQKETNDASEIILEFDVEAGIFEKEDTMKEKLVIAGGRYCLDDLMYGYLKNRYPSHDKLKRPRRHCYQTNRVGGA